uniref:Core Histone H2A/H2B/H3 domain-containing protein n=1 Tax=Catagonus wagneri TaxID=51154 RepID=A0A8C3W9M9_9CETA
MTEVENNEPEATEAETTKAQMTEAETNEPEESEGEEIEAQTAEAETTKAETTEAVSTEDETTNAEAKNPKQKASKARRCRRRRRRRRPDGFESFATYFPRVLNRVHTGLSLSQKAMNVMDSFVKDMFERIAGEASHLVSSSKRSTITSQEIQTSVRLLLPGEIGRHAVSVATKAIIRYTTSLRSQSRCS